MSGFLKIFLMAFLFFLVGAVFTVPLSFLQNSGAEVLTFSFMTAMLSSLALLDWMPAHVTQKPSLKRASMKINKIQEETRIVRLKKGIAVFKECEGKTVSRFYLCVSPKA